jgi:hypothetical protein
VEKQLLVPDANLESGLIFGGQVTKIQFDSKFSDSVLVYLYRYASNVISDVDKLSLED